MRKQKTKITLRRFLSSDDYTLEKIVGAVTIPHKTGMRGIIRVGDRIDENVANDLLSTCEVTVVPTK